MKEINDDSRTWSETRNKMKDFEINPEIRVQDQNLSQRIHSKRVKNCLSYLLVAAITTISLILLFVILDRSGRNPVLVYFQGVLPSKAGEEEIYKPSFQKDVASNRSFMEKNVESRYQSHFENDQFGPNSDNGHYQSVLELYMNRLFVTPLNKMSLTVPINDQILRSYQVEAIDYSIDDNMTLYLSLGHQLKINNETMILFDNSMNEISHFPTHGDEQGTEIKDKNQESNHSNNQQNNTENKLRNSENKRRLQQLQQNGYYNYTSTTEWNHKPEVVNNIIPTYYPRNPYVPPYGNPYYFAPNILVPYVFIY